MAGDGTATGWVDEFGKWQPDTQNHPASMTQEQYLEWLRNYQDGAYLNPRYRNLAYTLWYYEQKRLGNHDAAIA